MYGSNTAASIGERPSEKPAEMPMAAPTSRPSRDSSSVTARCPQSDPRTTHCAIRCAMSDGRLTKNASSTFSDTSACQSASALTPTSTCQNRTAGPEGPALRAGTARVSAMLHRPLTLDHFFAQHGPDRAVQIHERRRRAQFQQVARPLEGHRMACDDARRRSGGEDDDLVGERDRLLEIVRDEDDRLSPRWM